MERFSLKDPFSSLSHIVFAVMCFVAGFPLIMKGVNAGGAKNGMAMLLFVIGLVGLYSASGIYHALDISTEVNRRLRKFDHSMIYVLIAGTYSPVCLLVMTADRGYLLLGVVWTVAFAGIILALFWINCPKWFSSMIYIVMGWLCVFAWNDIVSMLTRGAFVWLLTGGIIYTVGGVIYALKLPLFDREKTGFGNHELFHLFCIGGSFCHYVMMFMYVAAM